MKRSAITAGRGCKPKRGRIRARAAAVDPASVRRAVEFIRERIEYHQRAFAWEVGEHLFVNIYGSDLRALRTGDTPSDTCIRRIAANPRVGISRHLLRACVLYYLMVKEHANRAGSVRPPLLSVWEWATLWPLYGDPEVLVTVAEWMERENVPRDVVEQVVRLAEPFARAGGRLEDLLTSPPGPQDDPDAPERAAVERILRMARIAAKWLGETPGPSAGARREALAIVEEILRLLQPATQTRKAQRMGLRKSGSSLFG